MDFQLSNYLLSTYYTLVLNNTVYIEGSAVNNAKSCLYEPYAVVRTRDSKQVNK